MGTKWSEKTLVEKILFVCSLLCLLIGVVLWVCMMLGSTDSLTVFETKLGHGLMCFFMLLSSLFQYCSSWKSRPSVSTIMIVGYCFMIGLVLFALLKVLFMYP